MTTDLWMLVDTAVLAMFVFLIYAMGRFKEPGGIAWAFGNRDVSFDRIDPWVARAIRAHQNLTENLAPFAILVLAAHVSGKANETTALGATIFFYARLAHVALYTTGWKYLRTAAFGAGIIGNLVILSQLLK